MQWTDTSPEAIWPIDDPEWSVPLIRAKKEPGFSLIAPAGRTDQEIDSLSQRIHALGSQLRADALLQHGKENYRPKPLIAIPRSVTHSVIQQLKTYPVEMGGLLIGRVMWSGNIAYWTHPLEMPAPLRAGTESLTAPMSDQFNLIDVIAAVPATDATGSSISLRMEASVWESARQEIQRLQDANNQKDLRVVGWYHSHPGIGAFFSQTDRETQASFFNHPYSVGWVIDPADGDNAWFFGPESQDNLALLV